MVKKLIWLTGGMASGKSTMRRLLTKVLSDTASELIIEDGVEITSFGNLAVVGEALEGGVCDGLDRSFGRLKKDGGLSSTEYSVKNFDITILEGSQTSGNWLKPLSEMCLKHNCEFYLVLMDVPYWENYKRLFKRIKERGGTEADMTNKRLESVRAKNKQFEGVFIKAEGFTNIHRLRLNTIGKTDEESLLECLHGLNINEI